VSTVWKQNIVREVLCEIRKATAYECDGVVTLWQLAESNKKQAWKNPNLQSDNNVQDWKIKGKISASKDNKYLIIIPDKITSIR
jgi:hypothetical protein